MDQIQVTQRDTENKRKIPQAIFLENLEEFVLKFTAEKILETLQEAYNKYKMMEMQIQKSKENMNLKIPEIQKALEIIEFMKKKPTDKPLKLDFLLNDTIWAKGKVKEDISKVNLWLGANTLVEFSFDEAIDLLTKNLENARGNQKAFEDDLMYLKDQITTCEVNIARVYNQNIKLIQEGKVQRPEVQQQSQ